MPSPFVGMDPFLEDPAIFPDLHDRLNYWLSDTLNDVLPPPYYSGLSSRVWIEPTWSDIDVMGRTASHSAKHVSHDEIRETYVDIHKEAGSKHVVTHVEVLSLIDKTPDKPARHLY